MDHIEEQKSEKPTKELPYLINITSADGQMETIPFTKKLIIGSSEEADIVFKEFDLKEVHCILKSQNELLSINNFGEKGTTLLNDYPLLPGKMYVLDIEDKISFGEINFVIKKNENFDDKKKVVFDSLPPHPEEDDEEDIGDDYYYEEDEEDYEEEAEESEEELKNYKDRGTKTNQRIGTKTFLNIVKKEENPGKATRRNHHLKGPFGVQGTSIRFACFITNLSLAYIFAFLILPFANLDKDIKNLLIPLQGPVIDFKDSFSSVPFYESLPTIFQNLIYFHTSIDTIYFLIIFILMDFIFHFFFTTSLPYLLVGIKPSEESKLKHLKAPLKSIIGIITKPFLIFDLPILFQKKSFKEWITRTNYNYSKDSFKIIGLGIALPFIVLIALISPFFKSPVQLEGLTFSEIKTRSLATNNSRVSMASSYFGLKFYKPLPDNFHLFPSLFKKGKKTIKKLTIYDSKKSHVITVGIKKDISIKPILKRSIKGSPFFPVFYPHIFKFVESKLKTPKVTEELKKEWFHFSTNSLKVDFFNFPAQIFSVGILPNAHLSFRKNLFKVLKVKSNSEAQSTRMGKSKVIILSPYQRVQRNSIYIFPSDNLVPSVLEIAFNAKSKRFAEKFLHKNLLRNIDWVENKKAKQPKYMNEVNLGYNKNRPWNAFSILDTFDQLERKILIDYEMIDGIYDYYESLSKSNFRFSDSKFNRFFKSSLREAIKIIKLKQNQLKTRPLSELIGKLESLLHSQS